MEKQGREGGRQRGSKGGRGEERKEGKEEGRAHTPFSWTLAEDRGIGHAHKGQRRRQLLNC